MPFYLMLTKPRFDAPFRVGETLRCEQYVERRDRESHIEIGDLVKVTHAFSFEFEGRQCQDLTVQHEDDMPIAVLAEPGRFARLIDAP